VTVAQTIPSAIAPGDPIIQAATSTRPRRLRRRRPRFGLWLASTWLVLIGGAALLASRLPIKDYDEIVFALGPRAHMGWRWPEMLGTDVIGRSMLSQLIYGAQQSLEVSLVCTGVALVVGSLLGVMSGYLRGRFAAVITVLLDVLLSFPPLVLLMAVTMVGARGKGTVIVALTLLGIPMFARLARAKTLALAEREFVQAARAMGASERRIVGRDLLPNVVPSLLPLTFVYVGIAIIAEGSLSFLGFGLPPPLPSWGSIINQGRQYLQMDPHITFLPAAVLMLTVLSLRTVGAALSRRFGSPGGR
jgi:peptide/nickel transport system permease protein